MSISHEAPVSAREEAPDTGGRVATAGSLLGALAMTSCCILPLVLVSMGVGGVWIAQLTALYAYKWYTFAIAGGFIGYGFWKLHRADTERQQSELDTEGRVGLQTPSVALGLG